MSCGFLLLLLVFFKEAGSKGKRNTSEGIKCHHKDGKEKRNKREGVRKCCKHTLLALKDGNH